MYTISLFFQDFVQENIRICTKMFKKGQKKLSQDVASAGAPGLLDGPSMFLGHCGLVRDCVWSSGAAHAAPRGHSHRLLDLRARRNDVQRTTRGADPGSRKFSKNEKIIDFQNALFVMRIWLDGLCMCISHGATAFPVELAFPVDCACPGVAGTTHGWNLEFWKIQNFENLRFAEFWNFEISNLQNPSETYFLPNKMKIFKLFSSQTTPHSER